MDTDIIKKIIHIDMDAFFASVEERDNPDLVGKPVAVGHDGVRGVVATANYVARTFGVHSAMAIITAKKLCPRLVVVSPRFELYRAVSKRIRTIYERYTDIIEPLSLDEAYLDVTENKIHEPSAWKLAQQIRADIYAETKLTASAGISYNKFLAKTASDIKKPNGQYLITPEQGPDFMQTLPIKKFFGIGPATTEKMARLGIATGKDLKRWSRADLKAQFGKVGDWYYELARGVDERSVNPNRIRKSTSAETTFLEDIDDLDAAKDTILTLANQVWEWAENSKTYGRTVTIKIKWADFEQVTRSVTARSFIVEKEDFIGAATSLIEALFPFPKSIRLLGVGISGFELPVIEQSNQLHFDI